MPLQRRGQLQVVTGPMFAGKTEELLRRVRRWQLAGLRVDVVSHAIDARSGVNEVASHTGQRFASSALSDVGALREYIAGRDPDVLAIDEAQFFGPELVTTVSDIVLGGHTVVVAGLCVTFDGEPFEPLPSLMAIAEEVAKLTAVCDVCGDDAAFHRRLQSNGLPDSHTAAAEHIGGTETYHARCRMHFGE